MSLPHFSLLWLWLVISATISSSATADIPPPNHNLIVRLPSGTYTGKHLPSFNQDLFLGIPYAHKPSRFSPSFLIPDSTTNGTSSAREYGPSCPAYGDDTTRLVALGIIRMDEDCLSLNVVRPALGRNESLPVLVWVYGGGWQQGATADPRYNMSHIIQQSTQIGKPIIGVSINYRTTGFGFLFGEEVMNSGNTNLGLRDQRVAMEFIQKNIGAFGGDPRKVTIWGESAGAYSVGAHLIAYGGRDDNLFRAAILDSGTAVGPPYNDTRWYQPLYDRVAKTLGCYNATDTLECSRLIPYDQIYTALNIGYEWFATIDGNFLQQWPKRSLDEGKFVKVPVLIGANTDEGVSFGVNGVNTDEEAYGQLISSKRWLRLKPFQVKKILDIYPNDPSAGSPYGTGNVTFPSLGLQYKRYSSIAGDLTVHAPRRLMAETFSRSNQAVYSYRFDCPTFNTSTGGRIGVQHFAEIPYVFSNLEQTITSPGNDSPHLRLSHLMARMWVSFVYDLDPNGHGVRDIPKWPSYQNSSPSNFVFRIDRSYVEADIYRREGIKFINTLLR